MPDSEKKCGTWGNFLYLDRVICMGGIWRVAMANREDVPQGCVPILPECDLKRKPIIVRLDEIKLA